MPSWNDLVKSAFYEMKAYGVGDPIEAADMALGQELLNDILDQWQGLSEYAFGHGFATHAVVASHQPHKIGPGQTGDDWDAARPMEIEAAEYQGASSDSPIIIIDEAYWRSIADKTIVGAQPIYLYPRFEQSYVSIYFWPVPSAGYNARLWTLDSVPQVDGTDVKWADAYALTQGYKKALKLTLAEDLCEPMGRPMPPTLPGRANMARVHIQNIKSPRIHPATRRDWRYVGTGLE